MEIESCLSIKLCSWKIIGNSFFEENVSIEFRCWCMVSELELKWEGNIWSFGNIKKFVLVSFYKWKKKMITTSITRSFHIFMLWQSGWQITTFFHNILLNYYPQSANQSTYLKIPKNLFKNLKTSFHWTVIQS